MPIFHIRQREQKFFCLSNFHVIFIESDLSILIMKSVIFWFRLSGSNAKHAVKSDNENFWNIKTIKEVIFSNRMDKVITLGYTT